MAVGDGRAGLRGLDGGIGDLFRRNRNVGMLADRIAGPGDRASDDDIGIHSILSRRRKGCDPFAAKAA
jgi:hypothetical protein